MLGLGLGLGTHVRLVAGDTHAGPDLAGGWPGAKLAWGSYRWETVKALGLKLQH